jgi:hypothetical protein
MFLGNPASSLNGLIDVEMVTVLHQLQQQLPEEVKLNRMPAPKLLN